MNSANIVGALLGGAAGYFFSRESKEKWWWTAGGAMAGAIAAPVATGLLSAAPSANSTAPTPASALPTVTPTPAPGASPATQTKVITLIPGQNIVVTGAALGSSYEVALPSGGSWASALTGDAGSSIGSAPSAGSNPAGFTFTSSGGSILTANWTAADGSAQTTTITLTP